MIKGPKITFSEKHFGCIEIQINSAFVILIEILNNVVCRSGIVFTYISKIPVKSQFEIDGVYRNNISEKNHLIFRL